MKKSKKEITGVIIGSIGGLVVAVCLVLSILNYGKKDVNTVLKFDLSKLPKDRHIIQPTPKYSYDTVSGSSEVIGFNYHINGSVEIELSNSLGTVVCSTSGTSIDVTELAAGIYFATLKVNGVASDVQMIQVQ